MEAHRFLRQAALPRMRSHAIVNDKEICRLRQPLRGIGGASVIHPLMQDRLIDEYHISIIPTILGSGIRLFGEITGEIRLRQEHTLTYNGIIELVYRCREISKGF